MKLTSWLFAAVLVLGSGAAWAATSDASSALPSAQGGSSDLASSIFPASADASAIAISLGSGFSLSNIRITVLDPVSVSSTSPVAQEPAVLLDQALSAGSAYFFQVRGGALLLPATVDTYLTPTTPVPEPGTLALMLSGLAVVVLGARRRRG